MRAAERFPVPALSFVLCGLLACGDDGPGQSGGSASGGSPSSEGGSASSSDGGAAASAAGGGGGGAVDAEITGYWVWKQLVENGVVTLEVTDADMEPKVGSTGWPGCPDGILCTHHGIHKVAFGESGRFHFQQNVTTSSDFQTLGAWADGADGHATFVRDAQFSCAHPESPNADVVPGSFYYELQNGELWLGVSDFGSFPLYDDGTSPTKFIVYKSVSHDDYYLKYMIRICQAYDQFMCHEACFDESLVEEP